MANPARTPLRTLLLCFLTLGSTLALGCDSGVDPKATAEPAANSDTPRGSDPAQQKTPTVAAEGPRSLLVYPTYLGDQPPPGRAIAQIRLVWAGALGVSVTVKRSFEETQTLATQLVGQLRAGTDFGQLARTYSAEESARYGGTAGTVTPGVLSEAIDDWVFNAEVGEVSDPFQLLSGLMIMKRIERNAACRTLQIGGTDSDARQRCEELRVRIVAGESFQALAREHSDDRWSGERGGDLAIFERGRRDTLLKAAAFELPIGGVSGPISSPIGWHLVQRVPIEELDPSLLETTFVRGRVILIQYAGAVGGEQATRWNEDALSLIDGLRQRIVAGEDMAQLAHEFSEDEASAARGGDLGWMHRGSIQVPEFMDSLFLEDVGTLLQPIDTTAGWVLLRREQ